MRKSCGRQQQVIAAKRMLRQGFRSCRSRPPPPEMLARWLQASLRCATSKSGDTLMFTPHVVYGATELVHEIGQSRGIKMGTIRMLSRRGDEPRQWDADAAESGDPEALVAVAEAERFLANERARGARAYVVRGNGRYVYTDHLVRDAREILLIPLVVGG